MLVSSLARAGSRAALRLIVPAAILIAGALGASGEEAPTPAPECPRKTFRVAIDVGHSARVVGAHSARGVPEYEFNLRLAKKVQRTLIDSGFEKVTLLIAQGPGRQLGERVARAGQAGAQVFVSIHHDSVPDAYV